MLADEFGPKRLALEERPKVPCWVKSLASWITLVAAGAVVVLELLTPIA